jgi:hypothetical protein
LQFSLRSLLLVVTIAGVAVYLATRIPGLLLVPLAFLHLGTIAGVTGLPLLIVVFSRRDSSGRLMGRFLIAAGVLLAIHLVATAAQIEMLIRDFALDLVPYDRLALDTLNWSVPAGLAAIPTGLALKKAAWRSPTYVVGGILLTGAAVGWFLYGCYLSGTIGLSVTKYVWWL